MASVEIHPARNTAPVAYDFISKTFIPSKVYYNKFDAFVNKGLHITEHIAVEHNTLIYYDQTKQYTGTCKTSTDLLQNKVKLKDILVHDKLRKQYYDAYIVHADDMYDGKNTDDYIKFVKDNPVLVDTIMVLANFQNTVAPSYLIDDLDECSQFLDQLRKISGSHSIPYKNIIKLHKQLIKICKMMDEIIEFHVEIQYQNATVNNIHANKYISLKELEFNNLYIEWHESGDDADQAYPIVNIRECKISGGIISDSNVRQLCIKDSNIGKFEFGNHTIFGIYLNNVNNGNLITLPNCSQTVFICALGSKVNVDNYKQMINFSKKHKVKIYNENNFLNIWQKSYSSSEKSIENVYLFNADFDPYDTNRYIKARTRLDCDAFIVSDDSKVEAFKYEKYIEANSDLPREMVELFISLLSK